MAQLEEGTLELDGENTDLNNDDFAQFDDDEDLKDLTIEIPPESRIFTYFGSSQAEDDWESSKVCDFEIQHFNMVNSLKQAYKYMSAKTVPTAEALNDYLDDFVDSLRSGCQGVSEDVISDEDFKLMALDLAENELTLLDKKNAVESFYIGRIRFGFANKRTTSKNIFLESSISYSKGQVVPLDLTLFKDNTDNDLSREMSLFPGQIVILKAQNPTGSYLRVTKFYPIAKLLSPSFPTKCSKILSSNAPFHAVCASGPFVSLDDENFDLTNTKNMRALAGYIRRHQPNVVFLCGPFFDVSHTDQIMKWSLSTTITENGTFPYQWSIEKLFHNQIRAFTKELEGHSILTKICFIPSPNELGQNNIFPTYPQELKTTIPIQTYASPSFLNVDNISIGVSTADVLLHMSRFEISNIRTANSDRLKRLCSHILDHRHFYPVCPPDPSLNVESSLYEKLSMPSVPHLLILPSVLRPFAFELNDTVVVNPGRVCQNRIARIKIDPVAPSAYSGSLSDYTNVEIIKLIQ